jgi:cysteine dioxygenase type I
MSASSPPLSMTPAPARTPRATPSLVGGSALSAVRRPRGRNLSGPELERFAEELAAQPELWIEHVAHDVSQRVYAELLSDAHVTAWLICWMDDQDTGFHDHDVSAGAVAVVGGHVCEERLALAGPPRKRTFVVGETFHFSASDIHRVRHGGSDPAVTLHVYSPPLERMGAYAIDEHGVLARHPMPASQELRPIARAG